MKVLFFVAGGVAGSAGMAGAILSEDPPRPLACEWRGRLDAERVRAVLDAERDAAARREVELRLRLDEARRAGAPDRIPFAADREGELPRIPAPAVPFPTRPEGD